MNFTIGQRISTRGEDFIITNSNANYDGSWLLETEGISELVKGKRFTFIILPESWTGGLVKKTLKFT